MVPKPGPRTEYGSVASNGNFQATQQEGGRQARVSRTAVFTAALTRRHYCLEAPALRSVWHFLILIGVETQQQWNHPEIVPTPVHGKVVFHETSPGCQKGWELLF